jgi:hypothetical protein
VELECLLIASENIPAGTTIIEYVGDFVNKAEMNRRFSEKKARKDKADLYIDAETRSN